MGRVILPISTIPYGTVKRWYPIGRTPTAPTASGKMELSLTLKVLDDAEVFF